jgi:MFS family permease
MPGYSLMLSSMTELSSCFQSTCLVVGAIETIVYVTITGRHMLCPSHSHDSDATRCPCMFVSQRSCYSVQDLDLTTAQYGVGSGLFFVGYSTFQLPSQIILRRVGAPMWLAIIVTVWGMTAACMAAVTDEASFYTVRLVLGFAEAGSFPAYWFYLTRFYPDKHITIPYSITDSAIMIAQVCASASPCVHCTTCWSFQLETLSSAGHDA